MTKYQFIILSSVIALLDLTQILFLRWDVEVIFFVTWLFITLVIQHDHRLSLIAGWILLACCLVMLGLKWDAFGARLAGYSFAFFAIGIIVQIEEVLLKYTNHPEAKLNIGRLSIPGLDEEGEMIQSPARILFSRPVLVFIGQLLGSLILILFFLNAVTGLVPQTTFWLGVLILLFVALTLGLVFWLLTKYSFQMMFRLLSILALLSILVGFRFFVANRPAQFDHRSAGTIALMDQLDQADVSQGVPEGGVARQSWTIDSETQRVLFHHPGQSGPSQISFHLFIPKNARLQFAAGLSPESWELPGDGVMFLIYVVDDNGLSRLIYSQYIDPKHNPNDRHWDKALLDLSEFSGADETLILETQPGPDGDYRNDWAGWADPVILY